jgi:hypothetical protein
MLIVQLLRKHGFDFLLNNSQRSTETIPARANFDSKGFRHVLYQSVLATDMSLHFVWMQRLQNCGQKISAEEGSDSGGGAKARDADADAAQERVLFAQALIKCADISNPVGFASALLRAIANA